MKINLNSPESQSSSRPFSLGFFSFFLGWPKTIVSSRFFLFLAPIFLLSFIFLFILGFRFIPTTLTHSKLTLNDLDINVGANGVNPLKIKIKTSLESKSNLNRRVDNNLKHFLFVNEYCQIFTERNASVSMSKINSGDDYSIDSFYLIEDLIFPSSEVKNEVYLSASNPKSEVGKIEILCHFPKSESVEMNKSFSRESSLKPDYIITGTTTVHDFLSKGLNDVLVF